MLLRLGKEERAIENLRQVQIAFRWDGRKFLAGLALKLLSEMG
jgi:hypothetical protein